MRVEEFAKIFETENGQVLVRRRYNQEKEKFELVYEMLVEGIELSLAHVSVTENDDFGEKHNKKMFEECKIEDVMPLSNFAGRQFSQEDS